MLIWRVIFSHTDVESMGWLAVGLYIHSPSSDLHFEWRIEITATYRYGEISLFTSMQYVHAGRLLIWISTDLDLVSLFELWKLSTDTCCYGELFLLRQVQNICADWLVCVQANIFGPDASDVRQNHSLFSLPLKCLFRFLILFWESSTIGLHACKVKTNAILFSKYAFNII